MIDSNELAKKVRIHKHNYAGEFGNVAVDPIASLVDELIANPEAFSKSERSEILEGYCRALQIQGIYGILGYDLNEQLAIVKEKMVPDIQKNCQLLNEIVSKERYFASPYLLEIINWANSYAADLCSKLNNIENDDKGEAKVIPIMSIVEKEFEDDQKIRARKGLSSFECFFNGRDCSNTMVYLDPDGFRIQVLHNIIENIHKWAFPDDPSKLIDQTNNLNWWKRFCMFFKRLFLVFSKKRTKSPKESIIDRQVRVHFTLDGTGFIKIEIKNNGKPLPSNQDPNKLLEYGIGSGSGIGMYSAADFLKRNGSTIEIKSTPNDEFTVHLIIKIPVYGKQV